MMTLDNTGNIDDDQYKIEVSLMYESSNQCLKAILEFQTKFYKHSFQTKSNIDQKKLIDIFKSNDWMVFAIKSNEVEIGYVLATMDNSKIGQTHYSGMNEDEYFGVMSGADGIWDENAIVFINGDAGGIYFTQDFLSGYKQGEVEYTSLVKMVDDILENIALVVKKKTRHSMTRIVFNYSERLLTKLVEKNLPPIPMILEQIRHKNAIQELREDGVLIEPDIQERLRLGNLSRQIKKGKYDYSIFKHLAVIAKKNNWSTRELLTRLGILDEEIFATIEVDAQSRWFILLKKILTRESAPEWYDQNLHGNYLSSERFPQKRNRIHFFRQKLLSLDDKAQLYQAYEESLSRVNVEGRKARNGSSHRETVDANQASPQKLHYTKDEIYESVFDNDDLIFIVARDSDGKPIGAFVFIEAENVKDISWINPDHLSENTHIIKIVFINQDFKSNPNISPSIFPALCGASFAEIAGSQGQVKILADWSRVINGQTFRKFEDVLGFVLKSGGELGQKIHNIIETMHYNGTSISSRFNAGVSVFRRDVDKYRAIKK